MLSKIQDQPRKKQRGLKMIAIQSIIQTQTTPLINGLYMDGVYLRYVKELQMQRISEDPCMDHLVDT